LRRLIKGRVLIKRGIGIYKRNRVKKWDIFEEKTAKFLNKLCEE
jgi:stalled ribosome alternative rescue factor ArfA